VSLPASGPVLVVPALEKGSGGGHLTRCASLVVELRSLGREAFLFLKDEAGFRRLERLAFADSPDAGWLVGGESLSPSGWAFVVLDRRRTPAGEFRRWAELAPVVGIDEGGRCRKYFDFLIDVIPGTGGQRANIVDASLLPLPKNKPAKKGDNVGFPLRRILVSFGREDNAGLGEATVRELAKKAGGKIEITFIAASLGKPSFKNDTILDNGNIIVKENIPDLAERLGEYDLLITHFGITAFQALYAGISVLLISPTRSHERLARKAGFVSPGIGRRKAKKLAGMVLAEEDCGRAFLEKLRERCDELAERHGLNRPERIGLAELLAGFAPVAPRNCPACGAGFAGKIPVVERFGDRSHVRCRHCGTAARFDFTAAKAAG